MNIKGNEYDWFNLEIFNEWKESSNDKSSINECEREELFICQLFEHLFAFSSY